MPAYAIFKRQVSSGPGWAPLSGAHYCRTMHDYDEPSEANGGHGDVDAPPLTYNSATEVDVVEVYSSREQARARMLYIEKRDPLAGAYDFKVEPVVLVTEQGLYSAQPELPEGVKRLSPLLPDEPTFTIRAKDNKAILALGMLAGHYGDLKPVMDWFVGWRTDNPGACKDPD